MKDDSVVNPSAFPHKADLQRIWQKDRWFGFDCGNVTLLNDEPYLIYRTDKWIDGTISLVIIGLCMPVKVVRINSKHTPEIELSGKWPDARTYFMGD